MKSFRDEFYVKFSDLAMRSRSSLSIRPLLYVLMFGTAANGFWQQLHCLMSVADGSCWTMATENDLTWR